MDFNQKQGLMIRLICRDFPGRRFGERLNVHVGIQKKEEVMDAVPGDYSEKIFEIPLSCQVDKDGRPNFFGPYVFGKRGDKFLYLVWFDWIGAGKLRFRRAKIKLNMLSWARIREAALKNKALEAHIKLTDHRGEPICASLKGDHIFLAD